MNYKVVQGIVHWLIWISDCRCFLYFLLYEPFGKFIKYLFKTETDVIFFNLIIQILIILDIVMIFKRIPEMKNRARYREIVHLDFENAVVFYVYCFTNRFKITKNSVTGEYEFVRFQISY